MNKPIVQVCFTLKGNTFIRNIRDKMVEAKHRLDTFYGEGNYLVKSCHLSREICRNEGFAPDIHDMFDEVFGEGGYECELTEKTLADAKKNMQNHREQLSMKADRLVVLSETPLTNVSLEIELFTAAKVMIV